MCGMAHERIVWVCVCALYSVGKSLKAFLSEISGNFAAVSKTAQGDGIVRGRSNLQ